MSSTSRLPHIGLATDTSAPSFLVTLHFSEHKTMQSNRCQMILETQQMRDEVMATRVRLAVSSNKLVRLDNPIVRERVERLKARMYAALETTALPPQAAAAGGGGGGDVVEGALATAAAAAVAAQDK